MNLVWWFKYRYFPDAVNFCGEGWGELIGARLHWGSAGVYGSPYPYFPVRRIADIPDN